jgi:hypothetical protein
MAKKKIVKSTKVKEASEPKLDTLSNLNLYASLKDVVDTFKDEQIMKELLAIEHKLDNDIEYEKTILAFEAGILYSLLISHHVKLKEAEA